MKYNALFTKLDIYYAYCSFCTFNGDEGWIVPPLMVKNGGNKFPEVLLQVILCNCHGMGKVDSQRYIDIDKNH